MNRHLVVFTTKKRCVSDLLSDSIGADKFIGHRSSFIKDGDEYLYRVIAKLDDAYDLAGMVFRTVTFRQDVPPPVEQYLKTRERHVPRKKPKKSKKPKTGIKSTAITQSAKGESCTANIVDVCNYDPETTIFSHFPIGAGASNKLNGDLCGGYTCSSCHDLIDGRIKCYPDGSPIDREFYMRRSMVRTLTRLYEKGLIQIKGAK